MPKNHSLALMALAIAASLVPAALAADDTLTLTFTTTTAAGRYSPRNVHAVYLADAANKFITTVGNGTAAKRALWGNSRAHDIQQWFAANPKPQLDIDARTGATETAYKTYTISWNWTQRDGSVVPDGTYKLKFEMTDDNAESNKFHRTEFPVTKGRAAWKVGPVTQGGYKDVVIQYTPAPVPRLACDPNSLDFGTQVVGLSADRTFNILNTGTAAATITALEVTGQDSGAYSLIPAAGLPLVLAAGGNSAVVVRFAPDWGRDYNQAQVAVTASGLAVAPVPLKGSGVVLPGAIVVSADTLDLGQVRPGDSKATMISMGNTGPGPLHVTSMTFTGPDAESFAAVGQAVLPATLLAGQEPWAVAIQFSPRSYKTCYANLAIASDDANRPVVEVALEGEGGPLQAETLAVLYGLGSQCRAIGMAGEQAVVGQGAVLSVYSVTDRCGPYPVSSQVMPGIIEGLTILEDTAYVALGDSGFAVVRIEEVNAPAVLSSVDTPGFCRSIARVGDRLCVADGYAGLSVYELSTAGAPHLVGALAGDIVAVAGLAAVAVGLDSQSGLQVIDVTHVALFGQENGLRQGAALVASGSTVYVADRLGGLAVVDLADPTSPRVTGRAQLASPGRALVLAGTVVAAAVGTAGMQLVDVSNPSQPVVCEPVSLSGDCTDLAVNPLGIYAVDRQFGVTDFRLPTGCQITRRRAFSAGMTPLGVTSDGTAAYVAGGSYGLFIWNMAEPLPPRFLGYFEGDVQAVAVSNKKAYLACGKAGLKVLDVSFPTSPSEIGSLDVGGYADRVACEGALALIATGDSVTILDGVDPCRPLATATWHAQAPVLGVTLSQGLGFVACGGQGLVMLRPDGTLAGSLDTPGVAYGVVVSNGLAYVADGPAGIQVVDVHSPQAPVVLGTVSTPGPVYAVQTLGNDLYGAGRFGVWRLDVTTPALPVLQATCASPTRGVSLAALPTAVLVADPQAGVLIVDRK